jgi:hypothetical protein
VLLQKLRGLIAPRCEDPRDQGSSEYERSIALKKRVPTANVETPTAHQLIAGAPQVGQHEKPAVFNR